MLGLNLFDLNITEVWFYETLRNIIYFYFSKLIDLLTG